MNTREKNQELNAHRSCYQLIADFLRGLFFVGVAWCLSAISASAQTPSPVYFASFQDAVTGDNTPKEVNHPNVTCDSGSPCYLPDPNVAATEDWVDNYTLDIYERPFGSGSGASEHLAHIDIVESSVGFDDDFLYYRIDLYGTESGGLPSFYSYEINFDADDRGDILVRVEDPSGKNGTSWGTDGVIAFYDQNENIGGPNETFPDGPGNALGGYETQAFDQGSNNLSGQPGGSDAVLARIDPSDNTVVELAVKRVFLEAINLSGQQLKASYRPYAAKGSVSENQFYLHDETARGGSGSPYPWLQNTGAPSSCPSSQSEELALTSAEREALDSGTDVDTGIFNPCYPTTSIYEFDNSGTIFDLATGVSLQFEVDMAVTKTASADPITAGATFNYTVTATNNTTGAGNATGVQVVDTLPSNVVFVSATPDQGSCSHDTGVVTCTLGDVANETSVDINIEVTAPGTAQTLTNAVSVSANETDSDASNDDFSLDTDVIIPDPLLGNKTVDIYDPTSAGLYAIPGNEVIYTIEIENPGNIIDLDTIIIVDTLPEKVIFYNGDFDPASPGSGPINFIEGTVPSALSCCALADVTYSSDPLGTASPVFNYTPSAGFDPNVTFLKVNPKGNMAAASGANNSSFEVQFRVRIE